MVRKYGREVKTLVKSAYSKTVMQKLKQEKLCFTTLYISNQYILIKVIPIVRAMADGSYIFPQYTLGVQ